MGAHELFVSLVSLMSNLVLYRKYRPQTFDEIIGQEHVVQTLTNAISSGMVSHAYLFSGPRGSGKTTIARLLAKAANCHNKDHMEYWAERRWKETGKKGGSFSSGLICNECSSCKEIMEGRSLDLIEIDAASHRGIDEIRELRDGIKFAPTKEKYKVFVIDECHQLTREAVNALLKTLEEPPSHAIFILATTEIHKMIPTIISRCQRFDFRKLTLPEITKRLDIISKKEKAKIEKPALELIALNSGGSIRDAESLLDQVLTFTGTLGREGIIKTEDIKDLLGLADISLINQFVNFISEKNGEKAVKFLEETLEKGYDPQEFAKALVRYLRQVMLLKISPGLINPVIIGLTKEEQEKIQAQSEKFESRELQRILNLFLEAENKMKYSSIPQLPLELAIVDIIQQAG
jgi:DNA polymerase-3 subunit gamma/tau